jgi:predicted DNA-binding ribbon-helix-helix protein
MALDAFTAVGGQTPKPRIVQHRGRRYSIRLEPVFWQSLEALAESQGMRLGRFIAERAVHYRGANFASHLRVLCMLDAEQSLARASLRPSQGNLVDLVMGCTSPGVVLSRQRTILAYNEALEAWLGPGRKPMGGAELTSVMQVRTRRPLNEIWDEMMSGKLARADMNVLHVEPGRVVAAAARLLALRAAEEGSFYAVMWLATGSRGGPQAKPAG